ncbi:hypothetical protein FBU30_004261 [Linnemannia zychae]|nr:hypothetical protein FBU30_004261 [Linnemannia zychae]
MHRSFFSDPRMNARRRQQRDRQDFFPNFNSLFYDPFTAQSQESSHDDESEEYEEHPFYTTLQKQRHLQQLQQQQERQRLQEEERKRALRKQEELEQLQLQQQQERENEARAKIAAAEQQQRQQQRQQAKVNVQTPLKVNMAHSPPRQQRVSSQPQNQLPITGKKGRRQRKREKQAAAAQAKAKAQQAEIEQDGDTTMSDLTNAFGSVYTTPENTTRIPIKLPNKARRSPPHPPVSEPESEEGDKDDENEDDYNDIWEQAAKALKGSDKQHHKFQQQPFQELQKPQKPPKPQRLRQPMVTEEPKQDEEMQEPQEDEPMEDTQTEEEEEPQPDPEVVRKSQIELLEISTSLDNLEKELQQIKSGKITNKRQVLMTEENLTKAMLRIDSVESSGDPLIRKQRKALINRTEQILAGVDDFKHRAKVSVPTKA